MTKKLAFFLTLSLAYFFLAIVFQGRIKRVLRLPETTLLVSSPTPEKSGGQVDYRCEKDKSVFELLLLAVNGRVTTKDYSFGKLVESINGLKGGNDGRYWLYFVEGKSATISADNYRCLDSEKIEWRLSAGT